MSDDSRVARATDPPRFIVSSCTGYGEWQQRKPATSWIVCDRLYNYRTLDETWIEARARRIAAKLNSAWEAQR